MVRVYDTSATGRHLPEDPTRCIEEVPDWTGWHNYQCQRKRKVGLYCTQHSKKHADPNKGWDIEWEEAEEARRKDRENRQKLSQDFAETQDSTGDST